MPVYCGEKFIEEAIRSVLDQTYPHWELLIINDGSTDNTEEIVLQIKDPRIRYFKQPNKGVSAARNVGLEKMKGDYFCFLDADDVLPPKSLEHRVNKFYTNPDIKFVDGVISFRDNQLEEELFRYKPSIRGSVFSNLVKLDINCFAGNTWMVKRELNKVYKFIEGLTHSEDICFYLSLAKVGLYDYVDEEILWYRKGHNSAMRNIRGLETGYHFYYSYAKSIGAVPSDLTYLRWRLRRIIFLSYLFDAKDLGRAVKSLFHVYK